MKKEEKMKKFELVYTKANTYRLHADKLRWTLFGGYLIIFGAVIKNISGWLYCEMWVFSLLYLLIVSVQHWFYNLFAGYVSDCERKLINGEELRSLDDYADIYGPYIKLKHPSYTFVLLIIALCSSYFFTNGLTYLLRNHDFFPFALSLGMRYIISGFVHVAIIILLSKNWNLFYNKIIKRWSNLWGGNFNYQKKVEINKESYTKLNKDYKTLYALQEDIGLYRLTEPSNKTEKKLFKNYVNECNKKRKKRWFEII